MTTHQSKTLPERVEGSFAALKASTREYLEKRHAEDNARHALIVIRMEELINAPNERTFKLILMEVEASLTEERKEREDAEVRKATAEIETSKLRSLIRLELTAAMKGGDLQGLFGGIIE